MRKSDPFKYEMARASLEKPSTIAGYVSVNRYRLLDTGMVQYSLVLKALDPAGRGHRYGWKSTSRMLDLAAFIAEWKARGFGVTVRRKPKRIPSN